MAIASAQKIRGGLFGLGILPLLLLVWLVGGDRVGPDPVQYVIEFLGHTAIALLLLGLALASGVRMGWPAALLRYRRMLGLFCFFYASLHLVSFVAFILGWQWAEIWPEIQQRPYISVGMIAYLSLTLLALSSNQWSMRRLRRNWKRLHRLVYVILVLVLVHVAWQLRAGSGVWFGYAVAATLLLLERVATSRAIARWRMAHKGPA